MVGITGSRLMSVLHPLHPVRAPGGGDDAVAIAGAVAMAVAVSVDGFKQPAPGDGEFAVPVVYGVQSVDEVPLRAVFLQ